MLGQIQKFISVNFLNIFEVTGIIGLIVVLCIESIVSITRE